MEMSEHCILAAGSSPKVRSINRRNNLQPRKTPMKTAKSMADSILKSQRVEEYNGGLQVKYKALKICGVEEGTRIGVAAVTLKDLRSKIPTLIASIGDDFKIVLEEDCTRIEDENYFQTLAENTVLKAVREGEDSLLTERMIGPGSRCTNTRKQKSSESKEQDIGLPKRKPLKICDGVKQRTRIGVVASTLKELRSKIPTLIASIGDDFKIVLEEDCTRIEDEDYFQTLKDGTVLVAVSEGEQWSGASSSLEAEFSTGFVEVDGKMTQEETSQRLAKVAGRIAENPAVLAFLPKIDLEVISDADLNELKVLLHGTKDNAEFIQDACERRLADKIASDEATELLKLYHRAKTEKIASDEATELPKRYHQVKTEKTDKIASDEATELLKRYHPANTEKGGSPNKYRRSPRKRPKSPYFKSTIYKEIST